MDGLLERQGRAPKDTDRPEEPKKLRRISRACDYCNKRSIRCKPSADPKVCQNCADFRNLCTYDRPAKKRGGQRNKDRQASQHASVTSASRGPLSNGVASQSPEMTSLFGFPVNHDIQGIVLSDPSAIFELIDVYFEVVYPIFPFIHHRTLISNLAARKHHTDQAFFAVVMAVCALALARAQDGAPFPGPKNMTKFQRLSSEDFLAAAIESIPRRLRAVRSLDWMRACAIIALVGIQSGRIDIMHQYLGLYHTIVSMNGLHDEARWPKEIGVVEMEERRRLFWSIYTLEVYSSIVWGGVIRCRESQSRVIYPSEIDDDHLSDSGIEYSSFGTQNRIESVSGRIDPNCWLHGWNFTTELYRILEHAIDDCHRRASAQTSQPSRRIPTADLFGRSSASESRILETVMADHAQLPQRFRHIREVTTNLKEDRFGFQAANIIATLQLLRMVLFTARDATVDQKCSIARELLDEFRNIPVYYLRAISAPLLHHITGIGLILGSVIEGRLSELSYTQVRTVLLSMADMLAMLEVDISQTTGTSARIRSQITSIDEYMANQRQREARSNQLNAQTQPEIDPSVPLSRGPYASSYGVYGDVSSEPLNFQLPPDMLDGFNWTFDMAMGMPNDFVLSGRMVPYASEEQSWNRE